MRVWLVERGGARISALDPWRPSFHVGGDRGRLARVLAVLRSCPFPVETAGAERTELFSGERLRVLRVTVPVLERDRLVKRLAAMEVPLYDADVHLAQTWHYDRGHFPLALCRAVTDGDVLVSVQVRDDPWAVDYELPSLRFLHLAPAPSEIAGRLDPNHAPGLRLTLKMDGRVSELEGPPRLQLETLARRVKSWDPDVITTDWGDSVLLPQLDELAREHRVDLGLSRDVLRPAATRKERTFYTYGRAVYQGGARYLSGRWHLDVKNSFMLRETDTGGLLEIARIAKIPVQRAARCTIGTSLSSMQTAWAWANGILIPMEKQQAEDFRPAADLLAADKGGLVYAPEPGWRRSVAEYDFTSMYPEMMVRRNISPETVNCACCPDAPRAPEIGHRLCEKRRGLVPSVLDPILRKRAKYKALYKSGAPDAAEYKRRADAHKWCLVTCFGYLGFKNARFGKIEAHECVTAWGREVLLRAKDAVERRGYAMLHALVDSLWITVTPEADLEELRRAIEAEAECPLALEGVYEWIRYCPSRRDRLAGVPGRYFGAFTDGKLKVRGIALRRRDTPPLLKSMQSEMLEILARVKPGGDLREPLPRLLDVVEDYRLRLREGRVTADELAILFHLSREPEEYVHDTVSSLAAKQLAAAGVRLHVGEGLRYVITSAGDAVKEWRSKPLSLMENGLEYDARRYLELLERAASEILDGLAPAARPKRKPEELELPLGW